MGTSMEEATCMRRPREVIEPLNSVHDPLNAEHQARASYNGHQNGEVGLYESVPTAIFYGYRYRYARRSGHPSYLATKTGLNCWALFTVLVSILRASQLRHRGNPLRYMGGAKTPDLTAYFTRRDYTKGISFLRSAPSYFPKYAYPFRL